ncbi:hypothetical protein BBD42_15510 [Paenibacillus sp. BIHB 4019]|uniref:Dephospho-CoA kinase n=1 Tax=Paenibacillus sp. BIHB 4019 TaxID=1870819 RepID=A0A1B2DJ65_9BACL|nr:adenylate kinase [Paenibacillus sp. BIHB 4019]ANY67715.1 hypothetical protein BBD42_15510 [Paenibacillus sp. BIHB 4019]
MAVSNALPNIALTGGLRAGKDAVAAYLTQKYGYTRFAFGDGIREVTRRLYPEMYANGEKPRALLQGFGQMAREFDQNVWINDMYRRIEVAQIDCDNDNGNYSYPFRAVISDLRQPNEYARCRAEGYAIIRVNAPDSLRIQRAVDSADTFQLSDMTHDTESHANGFAVDYEVENGGTLADLYAKIDEIMAEINGSNA